MKAYITNSNSKQIVYNLDTSNINTDDEIFHIDFDWFSQYEIRGLLAFKMLFQNPDEFFKQYRKKKTYDRKEYVYEGQAPAHHNSPNCDRILSSFHNYKLPEEIKKKGEDAIIEFRNWFKEHSYLMEDKMDLFLDRLRWKFKLESRPEVVDYKNSGVEIIQNLNLNELEREIEKKIKSANDFYTSSGKIQTILDHFGAFAFIHKNRQPPRENSTNYSNEEIWGVLKEFDEEFKTPIIFLLREYYKIKYNPELEFEGYLLEQLGFEPCRQCYDYNYLDNFESKDLNSNNYNNSELDDDDDLPF